MCYVAGFRCAYCYILNNARKSRPSSVSLAKQLHSNNDDTESKDTVAVTNTANEKESNTEKENVEAI